MCVCTHVSFFAGMLLRLARTITLNLTQSFVHIACALDSFFKRVSTGNLMILDGKNVHTHTHTCLKVTACNVMARRVSFDGIRTLGRRREGAVRETELD